MSPFVHLDNMRDVCMVYSTAFVAAGGIQLLVQLADAPVDSFVDDLYPADRALRPRFPVPAPSIPSAIIVPSGQPLLAIMGAPAAGNSSSSGTSLTLSSSPSALLFGRAATVALPAAGTQFSRLRDCHTLLARSHHFCSFFSLSSLVFNTQVRQLIHRLWFPFDSPPCSFCPSSPPTRCIVLPW